MARLTVVVPGANGTRVSSWMITPLYSPSKCSSEIANLEPPKSGCLQFLAGSDYIFTLTVRGSALPAAWLYGLLP